MVPSTPKVLEALALSLCLGGCANLGHDEASAGLEHDGGLQTATLEHKASALVPCTCDCQATLSCSCAEQFQCQDAWDQAIALFSRAQRDHGTRRLNAVPDLTDEQRSVLASKFDAYAKALASYVHKAAFTGAVTPQLSQERLDRLKRLRARSAGIRNWLLAGSAAFSSVALVEALAKFGELVAQLRVLCSVVEVAPAFPGDGMDPVVATMRELIAQLDAYGF